MYHSSGNFEDSSERSREPSLLQRRRSPSRSTSGTSQADSSLSSNVILYPPSKRRGFVDRGVSLTMTQSCLSLEPVSVVLSLRCPIPPRRPVSEPLVVLERDRSTSTSVF